MKASKSASAIGTRCLSSGKACRVAMAFVAPAPPANESVARNALSRAKVSSRADANSQQRLDASEQFRQDRGGLDGVKVRRCAAPWARSIARPRRQSRALRPPSRPGQFHERGRSEAPHCQRHADQDRRVDNVDKVGASRQLPPELAERDEAALIEDKQGENDAPGEQRLPNGVEGGEDVPASARGCVREAVEGGAASSITTGNVTAEMTETARQARSRSAGTLSSQRPLAPRQPARNSTT